MSKVGAIALREYKVTALTKGFIIGTFVLPLVIWGLIILVTAAGLFNTKKDPMKGVIAVIDTTEGAQVLEAFRAEFDPEAQKQRAREEADAVIRAIQNNPTAQMMAPGGLPMNSVASSIAASDDVAEVTVETISPDQLDDARSRVKSGDLLAIVEIGPHSLRLPDGALDSVIKPQTDDNPADDDSEAAASPTQTATDTDAPKPNEFRVIHDPKLDPEFVGVIRVNARRAIMDTRYRAAGMNPDLVRVLNKYEPISRTTVVTESGGEERSNTDLAQFLPFIFLMLLFIASVTGGQYLLMSTLEEKSSRVMEVLLSATSPMQLMIGKLLGQALVGLTILAIYSALGLAAADRFNVLSQIPIGQIPWLVIYFIIAYGLMASLNIAVGAAVNELRDTQALYPPITMLMMVPFVLMIPVSQNPAGWVSKLFSWVPFTTPYVMVMRLSQPSHDVALWELLGTVAVGAIGVAFLVWAAAKVFRIGVLMYGKPPSLMGLVKWIRTG